MYEKLKVVGKGEWPLKSAASENVRKGESLVIRNPKLLKMIFGGSWVRNQCDRILTFNFRELRDEI